MQLSKRIFINGTNRGLGKSLVKLLHKDHPSVQIHASSRGPADIFAQEWQTELPGRNISTYQIDLNNQESITQSVESLKSRNIQLDWVVANAAVGVDFGKSIPSFELANKTLHTNLTATIDFIKQFLPILSPTGRVVIVSAMMGALKFQKKQLVPRINDPKISEQEILNIAQEYIECTKEKNMGSFNLTAYGTSKALLNTWSRFVLPKYLKESQSFVCMHPGWCKTEMGGKTAPLTADQGAELINKALWIPETDPQKFFNQKWCDYHTCQ